MGTKRVGLARTQALLENLKREINLSNSTTLKGMNLTVANESATYGAGMVSTEIAPQTSIQTIGGDIVTTMLVDLTGLGVKGDAAGDAIGLVTAAPPAYLMQYVVATHGILYKVEVAMLELGVAGSGTITNTFDVRTNSSATIGYDGAVGANILFEGSALVAGASEVDYTTTGGVTTEYVYLTEGNTGASTGVYNAGKLVIKLYGRASF